MPDLVAAVVSAVPSTAAFDSTCHRLKIRQFTISTADAPSLKGIYGHASLDDGDMF